MKCYFFGTFNPIHLGHVEIARKVKELAGFEQVIFVPAYMPPHKIDDMISFSHRFEMAKLAVGVENVSDIETKLKPPSYTYRTIEKLYEQNNCKKDYTMARKYIKIAKTNNPKNEDLIKQYKNSKFKFLYVSFT